MRLTGPPLDAAVFPASVASWSVLGFEWLAIDANDRRSAVEATRAAVASG
jgi:hypothetical protein